MSMSRSLNLRPWIVVTALCLLYVAFIIVHNNGNPLALVTIGTRFSEGITDGTEGYDGQFVYYIARDPSSAAQYQDVPAYRFQRILLPILGRVLAFEQESLIPWTLLLINLISLASGTWILEQLLIQQKVSRWYALSYGLTVGIFASVRLSLSEPLAYALVLGGVFLIQRERWGWSAIVFALAALAKETTLFFVAGYGLYLLVSGRWLRAVLFGVIALIPFLIWQIIMRSVLGSFGVGSGGALATSFEIIPFVGVIRILTDTPPQSRPGIIAIFSAILIPFVIVPTLWGLWRCWVDLRKHTWTAYTWLVFANAAIMPFVPFSTYREPLGILRFIVGLQIAIILYAAERHQTRALRNSTIWIVTVLFAFSLLQA
ncbi:MAG: hypothetical protein ABI690_23160 [Chloroflexota bacterium]